MLVRFMALYLSVTTTVLAQTNDVAPAGQSTEIPVPPLEKFQSQTNQGPSIAQRVDAIRTDCIQNRRIICGKILKVLPDGLVVDSGYTNLSRPPLNGSWLVPGTAVVTRADKLVENSRPDSFCVGQVFLTDFPKARGAKPRVFDYVNLEAFPAGQYTYISVTNVQRTVRKFTAKLQKAVQWKLDESEKQNAPLK
jgi:hypothetical protein